MMRPYSEDLREHALLLAEQGATIRAIGDALQISPSRVSKWRKLQRETGSLKHGKIGGHKRPVLSGATASWLRERFRSGPFTMRKLKSGCAAASTRPRLACTCCRLSRSGFRPASARRLSRSKALS
jgi:transposase